MKRNFKDEIQEIQLRIDELRQVANSDIGASFKEAVQTEEMIKMLEIRLHDLKKESKDAIQNLREFTLRSLNRSNVKVTLTDGTPDPSNNIFSDKSPIGKVLSESHPGDKIKLRGVVYIVE